MAISFKGAHFPQDIILMGVRWYVASPLSYRHVEEFMDERGVSVDHATIQRWVVKYGPVLEEAFHRRKRPVWVSWRMDETYMKVKGQWCYRYRAVDRHGQTIDFLLTEHRDKEAALRFPQIFHDEGLSGAQVQRPGLDAALAALTPGDVLVVWRLDRLGRSMPHLVSLVHTLGLQGVGLQALTEAINTTTAGGKLVFHIMGALAEFERALIAERSHAGMQAARRRGKHLGRLRKLTWEQVAHADRMMRDGTETVSGMAALYGVNRVTLHRALKHAAASDARRDRGTSFPPRPSR